MSSTTDPKRTGQLDAFKTPDWVTEAIIPYLPGGHYGPDDKLRVLEPACGGGEILRVLARNQDYRLLGIDIKLPFDDTPAGRKEAAALRQIARIEQTDFLQWWPHMNVDLIVTNPPFNQAQEFLEHSFDCLQPGGEVWLLLRMAFLASAGRRDYMAHHTPDQYVLPVRPSFYGGLPHHHGKEPNRRLCRRKRCTDSADYAWFRWENLHGRTSGRLHILPLPPKEVLDAEEEEAEATNVPEDQLQPA